MLRYPLLHYAHKTALNAILQTCHGMKRGLIVMQPLVQRGRAQSASSDQTSSTVTGPHASALLHRSDCLVAAPNLDLIVARGC